MKKIRGIPKSAELPEKKEKDYVKHSVINAVHNNNLEELEIALQHSPGGINFRNVFNENALHIAVRSGNFTIVQCLVSSHINLDQKNDDGQDPIDIAIEIGHQEVISLLLRVRAEQLGLLTSDDHPDQDKRYPAPTHL